MKKSIITLIGYLFFSCGMFAETNLSILPIEGVEQMYSVSAIGKIIFQDSLMCLYSHSGQMLGSTPVNKIAKMVFTGNISNIVQNNADIVIYPNPTNDILHIKGLSKGDVARVYSVQGQLLLSIPFDNQEAMISVQQLPCGVYYLQLGAQLFKFIKK